MPGMPVNESHASEALQPDDFPVLLQFPHRHDAFMKNIGKSLENSQSSDFSSLFERFTSAIREPVPQTPHLSGQKQ